MRGSGWACHGRATWLRLPVPPVGPEMQLRAMRSGGGYSQGLVAVAPLLELLGQPLMMRGRMREVGLRPLRVQTVQLPVSQPQPRLPRWIWRAG